MQSLQKRVTVIGLLCVVGVGSMRLRAALAAPPPTATQPQPVQSSQGGTPAVQGNRANIDPAYHDPIIRRDCDAEFMQKANAQPQMQLLGGAAVNGGVPNIQETFNAEIKIGHIVETNRLVIERLECRLEQANRKLDYILQTVRPGQ